jgi:hypothetical protein
VFLPPGHYQLSARIRVSGVEPATQTLPDDALSGADVRISGDQPKKKLLGEAGWTTYEFTFEIEPEEDLPGEQPATQVELVCELQASRGDAWFDEDSLELVRTPQRRL